MSEEVYRNYEKEKAEGVDSFRGIMYGMLFALSSYIILAAAGFGIFKLLG